MHILNLIVIVTVPQTDNIHRGSFFKLLVFTEINSIGISYFQTFKSVNMNAPAFVQKYPQDAHNKTLLKHAQIHMKHSIRIKEEKYTKYTLSEKYTKKIPVFKLPVQPI